MLSIIMSILERDVRNGKHLPADSYHHSHRLQLERKLWACPKSRTVCLELELYRSTPLRVIGVVKVPRPVPRVPSPEGETERKLYRFRER